ncbi:RelA/SpoT domain-containing protein [Aquidulcibacter paucihalophilus]|uniref:RelA/SpoT domain-containing protein n=1 Tax=Aquidulcibacter paucihalophilus TaxID=1978549 RepID=UPI000A18C000|nr:RelA/SpoT domain-containing protein [Aquidulcibacter paucihalophilus]
MNLVEYENGGRVLYADFAEAVAAILRAAVAEQKDLRLQNIQYRAKDVSSLRAKLAKFEAQAELEISDIAKDIAGCRLIFYTNGDVYRFRQSRILHENFTVDKQRSKMHYPDSKEDGAEFFISENWVVTLSEPREALPEYRRFAGLRCEIQVQTILDHAWAEMAHDTIYKPMLDKGFGAAKVEAMRKRLRKTMQDFLQPAGYEFDKIASDYGKLRDGKAMFDEDALGLIRACDNRNRLDEAVEKFANYVLPNYDDYIAAAPEIIDTLSDAVIRAPTMPDVPQKSYLSEYPGTKSDAVVSRICSILESGYLLYACPGRMFNALIAMRDAMTTEEERKPIDNLTKRLAQHDRSVWQKVGPAVQRMLVDCITELEDTMLVTAAPIATIILREVLSSSVTGTSWQADTVTFHSGSVLVTEELRATRHDALQIFKRLHSLLTENSERSKVRRAMFVAGDTPNMGAYSDLLVQVILEDLADVIGFFTGALPSLDLESKRQVEVELYRKFRKYHALPPNMTDKPELVARQTELIDRILACHAALEIDPDLSCYRLLVGFDSVTPLMWSKDQFTVSEVRDERTLAIAGLVASVNTTNADEWLARIDRFVETQSEDRGTFSGLQEFLKGLAEAQPGILLKWMQQLSDRLAFWVPDMLLGMVDAGQIAVVDPLIETWITEGKHLSSIAWYLQFTSKFRFEFIKAIKAKGIAAGDELIIHNVTLAAARQSDKNSIRMFEEIFLPAAQWLSSRGYFGWVGHIGNWDQLGLLKGLSIEQVEPLLELLIKMPRLGTAGEALLAVVAGDHLDAVIDLVGRRFLEGRATRDAKYEDLPYQLYYLRAPLAAAPLEIVTAARGWFETNPSSFRFGGARLIAELFPNLEEPIEQLLRDQIAEGREGIEFVLSVLLAFEGQQFLHTLLRLIVGLLPADDELLGVVDIVINRSGVLLGEYGSVEAQQSRKALVAEWETDESEAVRNYAASFVRSAENQLALERRRADRSIGLGEIAYET